MAHKSLVPFSFYGLLMVFMSRQTFSPLAEEEHMRHGVLKSDVLDMSGPCYLSSIVCAGAYDSATCRR